MRAESLSSVLANYDTLQSTWKRLLKLFRIQKQKQDPRGVGMNERFSVFVWHNAG